MSDVLERNVRLLLRRSYVPALPAPLFRDRLEALFLSEVERVRVARVGAGRRTRSGGLLRFPAPLRAAVAVAAAVVALFLGWRAFSGDAATPRERLLARGEVALGFPDGSWRAADEEERFHGLQVAVPTLVVLTPEGGEIDLLVGAGRVHVDELSELSLAREDGEVVATLSVGSAWFHRAHERFPLVRGVALPLRAAEPAPASPLASASELAPREALEPTRSTTAPSVLSPPARALTGTVVAAADGAPIAAFTVAILSEWQGQEIPPPLVREFASPDGTFRWPDPPAGKQRVFVNAPGLAMCALGEHDLGGALPDLRAELVPGVSVRGSVLDAEGNPVPGARVISEDEAPTNGLLFSLRDSAQFYWLPIQALTGADGRFELAHLNPGKHTLRAHAEGFAPTWLERVVVPRTNEAELVFELGPGGIVEGTVTRDDGGPRADAEIVVAGMDQVERARMSFAQTRTDAAGHYRFEHLPEMTMIVVRAPSDGRLDPEVSPVQVVEGETVVANFGTSTRGSRLHGRLLAHDGKPLARQNVGLFDADSANWNQDWVATSTRPDGAFEFLGVQPGRYMIYLIEDMGRGLRCVDELSLSGDAPEVEREVRMPGGGLTVTVFDARKVVPVAQAVLIVMRIEDDGSPVFNAFGMTDGEGRFEFAALRAGSYRVFAYPTHSDLGFASGERVEVGESGTVELEIGLEAGGPVDVVVRTSDGRPLEKAVVIFHDEAGEEHLFARVPMTDASGRFRAHCVRPGRYQVEAHLEGHEGAPVEFHYELGRELEVPVVLAPLPR